MKKYNISAEQVRRYFHLLVVVFGLMLVEYLNWRIENIIVFCLIIWSILNLYPSRFYARATLAFLLITPLLLTIKRISVAEQFAQFSFYFLILTVIMLAVELRSKLFVGSRKKANGK